MEGELPTGNVTGVVFPVAVPSSQTAQGCAGAGLRASPCLGGKGIRPPEAPLKLAVLRCRGAR